MEDGVAEITARYHGWKTRSLVGVSAYHHRELGTVGRSVFSARFTNGMTEYVVGFSFLYHTVRALSRLGEKPFVVGSILLTAGYVWGLLSRRARLVPNPIVRFLRKEQTTRLKSRFLGAVIDSTS
jgi:hypothetical protein